MPKLSAIVNGRNEINTMHKSFNDIDAAPRFAARQPKFFGLFEQPADTKEFKTGYELNPAVADRLSAFISFGKSHVRTPACADTSSSSSSFTSSSSATATSSSSSSTSISSSSSAAAAAAATTGVDGPSQSASSGSLPSSASISASESQLPTNEQYYPIAIDETQTNNDIDNQHQYHDEQQDGGGNVFGKFEEQKKAWSQIVNAPAHALQKMRKFHADAIGLGPLYGTDHFAPRKNHRSKIWIWETKCEKKKREQNERKINIYSNSDCT